MVTLAVKTLKLINDKLMEDQGNSYRSWLKQVMPHVDDIYRSDEEGFRYHMGASVIGGECGRRIWYGFRWVRKPKFEGRMIRLFNRGHIEEARFIALLLMIGVQVYQQDANGKQFRISDHGGLFGGSGDGIAIGIPDLSPGMQCLLEFKTHNDKSFNELKSSGVKETKLEHFVQMQTYMNKMGIPVALYGAVNKNTDELHFELVVREDLVAEQYLERGGKLIFSSSPPKKIHPSPGFWKCRFCDDKDICHNGAPVEINCRTCENSCIKTEGGRSFFYCYTHNHELTKEMQLKGCDAYQLGIAFK